MTLPWIGLFLIAVGASIICAILIEERVVKWGRKVKAENVKAREKARDESRN